MAKAETLKRPKEPMPAFVRQALEKRRLLEAYAARPAYQRNDYLGWWINRAKLDATKQKRLDQMLGELVAGDLYMSMAWRPPKTR